MQLDFIAIHLNTKLTLQNQVNYKWMSKLPNVQFE